MARWRRQSIAIDDDDDDATMDYFFPITPRVIGVDPVSRPIASRVSRLYGKTVTFETVTKRPAARSIRASPRASARVHASHRARGSIAHIFLRAFRAPAP
jgi:hypothetical protein|tara:strand:- start:1331 stop:1630 length:300 start_codon:yes stop_codon:yes gene_type:complete